MYEGPRFLRDLRAHGKSDVLSGLVVCLLAIPLSLGIAVASGFPAQAGILTAVVGGLLATFLGSARLSIKGPAAGLTVFAIGAVTELGAGDNALGYRRALATIAVAGAIQVVLALLRAGNIGDLFPSSVLHGMLAAVGVGLCSRQVHTLLGVTPDGGAPLSLLAQLPHSITVLNPDILLIGSVSLAVLLGMPMLPHGWARTLPPPVVAVLSSVVLGSYFDLSHEHQYQLHAHTYSVGPRFLLALHGALPSAIAWPDWSAVSSDTSLKYIAMFSLVGSLESLLGTRAVDELDPLRGRSDLDRDLLATGFANLVAGMIGGLPMISEVVRSSANIAGGARTRNANFFHGLFLLLFVSWAPWLLSRIPLATLAAMLIDASARLISPRKLARAWRIGREQLAILLVTLLVCLATDLLVGVAAGMATKVLVHALSGMPLRSTFRPPMKLSRRVDAVTLEVGDAAVFTNFLAIKQHLQRVPRERRKVIVDLADTRLVDHTVMENLDALRDAWRREGRELCVVGLDGHTRYSDHPLSARRKVPATERPVPS